MSKSKPNMSAQGTLDLIRDMLTDIVGDQDDDEDNDNEDDAPESDDFNPADRFGGNFDDAYQGGIDEGRADLARELLKLL